MFNIEKSVCQRFGLMLFLSRIVPIKCNEEIMVVLGQGVIFLRFFKLAQNDKFRVILK